MLIIILTLLSLGFGIFLFLRLSPVFGGKPDGELLQRMQSSLQFQNGQFHNPIDTPMSSPEGPMSEAMKEYFRGGVERAPKQPPKVNKVQQNIFEKPAEDARIIWLGHSSVLIQMNGKTLLTDPMFGFRASPLPFLGPKRFNDELPLAPENIPHLDAIFLSHDHYDHLDYGTIKKLHRKTDRFFVPLGVGAHLRRWGVADEKIIELDWWEESSLGDLRLVATPSRHFSGRGINGRNGTLWCSWAIIGPQKIYFGADSGYGPHFKEIGEKLGPFDLTMLENGAYSRYWPFIHMQPEETAQAHLDVQGRFLLPIHWGQFNLSLHPWTEPIERLLRKANERNIDVATPEIGEMFNLNGNIPKGRWWEDGATKFQKAVTAESAPAI